MGRTPPSPSPQDRYVADPAALTDVGDGMSAVVARGRGGLPELVPSYALELLAFCGEFRTPREQIEAYAAYRDLGSAEVASARDWYARFAASGVLVREADALERLRELPGREGGSIRCLGVPTGGSAARVLRVLNSFLNNARKRGRPLEAFVATSERAADAASLGPSLAAWAAAEGADAWLASPATWGPYADRLARAAGAERGLLDFAFGDPEGAGFACGANRNLQLLHGAGEIVASADDDVVCRPARTPSGDASKLRIFSIREALDRWYFGGRDEVLAAVPEAEVDFFGEHERMVGRGLSGLAREFGEVAFAGKAGGMLGRMAPGCAPRVAASFSGHYLDPGIPTSVYLLCLEGENLARLTESEGFYRRALGARASLSVAPEWMVGDSGLTPGMAFAVDAREVVPPFFPVLHAEDWAWGGALNRCVRDGFVAHLPHAVMHDPGPGKTIVRPGDLGPEEAGVVFEFAHIVRHLFYTWHPAPGARSTAARIVSAGRYLREIAGAAPGDFEEFLRLAVVEMKSAEIAWYDRIVAENDGPDFWREDVAAYLEGLRAGLGREDFDIPWDLRGRGPAGDVRRWMARLLGRYGELMEAWPSLFGAALELKAEGVRPGGRCG
jgi:hypothetical protein